MKRILIPAILLVVCACAEQPAPRVRSEITLDSVIGQPIAGIAGGGDLEICAGFGCALPFNNLMYMPVVVK